MNDTEKEEFKNDIVEQVQGIVSAQHEANTAIWNKFNADLGDRFERILPNVLNKFMPKDNRGFILFNSILNGVVVGATIYLAMYLFGA